MADAAQILQDALSLEAKDRARIARELIESLEESDADADALWREEIRARIDQIEAGTAELEDWPDVRDRLRAAVKR